MNRSLSVWLGLLGMMCCVWLPGCTGGGMHTGLLRAYAHPEWRPDNTLRVVVVPLENLTVSPNAGLVVAQLLTTEMYAQHLFQPYDPEALRDVLATQPLEKDRKSKNNESLRQIGAKLNVDAVLSGSVTEFSYQHGVRQEPIVGLHLIMIRVTDGTMLWQASHSLRGGGFLNRETLVATAQRAVQELVTDLIARTSRIPIKTDS